MAAMNNEIDALKASVADLKKGGDAGNDSVRDLQNQVKSLSGEVAQLKSAGQSGGADTDSLKQGLSDAKSRLDDLDKKVAALQETAGQGAKEARLATVVAATALKSAIDRGGSFAPELKVYQSVAPADKTTQQLSSIASEGVSSQADLVAAFPDTADAIMEAVRGNSADSGVFDRLLNSARSVIKVRPTGNLKGNTPSAVVARMGAKLRKGDLKGVVDEWQSLPDAGRKASQSFIDGVKKRLTAEQAAESAIEQASASTGKQG